MANLFVYGTLLFPEIIEGLTQTRFKSQSAVLENYKRCNVIGCDFPAVIRDEGSSVEGKILFDVTNEALELLTFFEGDDFKKIDTQVQVDGNIVDAFVYVWNSENGFLDETDWQIEAFEQESLQFYKEHVVPETIKEFKKL